jgi:hypothetical protein
MVLSATKTNPSQSEKAPGGAELFQPFFLFGVIEAITGTVFVFPMTAFLS